eukprot:675626-Hanusia_phi.AAC.1
MAGGQVKRRRTVKTEGEDGRGDEDLEQQGDRVSGSARRNRKAALTGRENDQVLNEPAGRNTNSRCEHGRQRSKCKACGGKSVCEHGR